VPAIQSTSFAWRLEACLAMGRPEFSEAARGSTSHTTKATLQAGALRRLRPSSAIDQAPRLVQ